MNKKSIFDMMELIGYYPKIELDDAHLKLLF